MVEGLAWSAELAQGIKEGITTGPEIFSGQEMASGMPADI